MSDRVRQSKFLILGAFFSLSTGVALWAVRYTTLKTVSQSLVAVGILLLVLESFRSWKTDPFEVFIDLRPVEWWARVLVIFGLTVAPVVFLADAWWPLVAAPKTPAGSHSPVLFYPVTSAVLGVWMLIRFMVFKSSKKS